MALKDDYKDYISKTEDKKFNIRENTDGTHSLIDVTEYTQLGDKIHADDINKINQAINGLLDRFYPVGLVIEFNNNVDPNNIIGGTWQRFGAGRVTVGFDASQTDFNSVEKTGGFKTHTLTTGEMPTHAHGQVVTTGSNGPATRNDWTSDGRGQRYAQGVDTTTAGSGQAHNNLQPYITVFRWVRTK